MNEGLKESTKEGRNEGCFELRSKEVKLILTAILLIRYQWCEINPNSHFWIRYPWSEINHEGYFGIQYPMV